MKKYFKQIKAKKKKINNNNSKKKIIRKTNIFKILEHLNKAKEKSQIFALQ